MVSFGIPYLFLKTKGHIIIVPRGGAILIGQNLS